MQPAHHERTRFARFTRRQAAAVIVCAAAFLFCAVLAVRRGPLFIENTTARSDVKTFRNVVHRIHAGEAYYDAFGGELRAGGYYSRSVFNWRTPLHLTAIAFASEPVSRAALAIAALAAAILASIATERAGGVGAVQFLVTGLAISECFLFTLDFHLFPEVWAGVLILISVSAYALRWERAGAAFGILALFVRELALPYAAVGLWISLCRRRKSEARVWILGLTAWAAYFLVHAYRVSLRMNPGDLGTPLPWLRFGGPRFLVTTTKMSLLMAAPDWIAAVCLTVMLIGIAGWETGIGNRVAAAVGAYMVAFAVVGMPMNLYWGAITNPLLAFGLVWSAAAIRDLTKALYTPACER